MSVDNLFITHVVDRRGRGGLLQERGCAGLFEI